MWKGELCNASFSLHLNITLKFNFKKLIVHICGSIQVSCKAKIKHTCKSAKEHAQNLQTLRKKKIWVHVCIVKIWNTKASRNSSLWMVKNILTLKISVFFHVLVLQPFMAILWLKEVPFHYFCTYVNIECIISNGFLEPSKL